LTGRFWRFTALLSLPSALLPAEKKKTPKIISWLAAKCPGGQ